MIELVEMEPIGDRALLILGCALLLLWQGVNIISVAGLLVIFSVTCLGLYSQRKEVILLGLGLYLLMTVLFPAWSFFIPIILYEEISMLRLPETRRLAVGELFALATVFLAFRDRFAVEASVIVVGLEILAVWLNCNCDSHRKLHQELLDTRDDGVEQTMYLEKQNELLQQTQDNEIYTATLKERNRIAREIHDNVGHTLTRSLLMIGALLTINRDETMKEGLEGVKENLDDAMNNIRASVHDLHDESLDLQQAVKEALQDLGGFHVEFDYDMSPHIPREIKYCLIAIVKEGISNIIKHSNGKRIELSLQEHPAFYRLVLEDDGDCENPDVIYQGQGIGMRNISDRVKSLHGNWNVTAGHQGFRIFVSIPKQKGSQNDSSGSD